MIHEPHEPGIVSKGARPTLLIVDDDEGPRRSLDLVFRDDYEVVLAESGAEALRKAEGRDVDAAVLDIRMAGMTGIELLSRLKALDGTTQVIMLTGYQNLETARQALRLGACDYLDKPFEVEALRAAVRKAVETRGVAKDLADYNRKLLELQAEIGRQKVSYDRERTRGEVYASIIHDMSSPLTAIGGMIELMQGRFAALEWSGDEDFLFVREKLAAVRRQVRNCIEISGRYLQFLGAPGESGGQMSVNRVLSDVEELLTGGRELLPHALRVRRLAEDHLVELPGTDLLQIVLNLARNALQSTAKAHRVEISAAMLPEGTVDRVELLPGVLMGRVGSKRAVLAVQVWDDGPGIAKELQERVFEPYFTTRRQEQGAGLGLAIVRRLVTGAGGAVHLSSGNGEGTRFTVYLPVRFGRGGADGAAL